MQRPKKKISIFKQTIISINYENNMCFKLPISPLKTINCIWKHDGFVL